MKRIAILGSTGSIGVNALDVVRNNPEFFKITGLSTNSNINTLSSQIKEFKPNSVCVVEKNSSFEIKGVLKNKLRIFNGPQGLIQMLESGDIDKALLAISGSAALAPLLKALDENIEVALANKEALVMAGPIIMEKARRKNVNIIPVDSEESAIWQCLQGEDKKNIKNIYLTASGGPFRGLSGQELNKITVEKALKHPRWKMGKKITIDSATLMNKGLELLETMYLFDLPAEKIKIIIHPESIIHSMVEYTDGAIIAQLSITDMRIPIQYALSYPQRLANRLKPLDFFELKQLNFERPDFNKFRCLKLAYQAAFEGGTMPCVLNAANEVCVEEFLRKNTGFSSIAKIIEKVMDKHKNYKTPDLGRIFEADLWARKTAREMIN
ncbi:MAG: 1-deoxy-D-xylulose-5-phosphate reductoisomerase [Candidatus Omnitrophota bacterium]